MKYGLIFLILLVVAGAALFIAWLMQKVRERREVRWELAKQWAPWETFVEPRDDDVVIGIQRVARLGDRCEVLGRDSEVREINRADFPRWELGLEVEFVQREMEEYAELLNKSNEYRVPGRGRWD